MRLPAAPQEHHDRLTVRVHQVPAVDPASIETMKQRFSLDLTGPDSHTAIRELGVGELSIGPTDSDLIVDENEQIRWKALDDPGLSANDWPDRVQYQGADPAFAAWVTSRPGMTSARFIATGDTELDFTDAVLQYLTVEARGHQVTVRLPSAAHLDFLSLVGEPDEVAIRCHPDGETPGVILHLPRDPAPGRRVLPTDGSEGARTLTLPPGLLGTRDIAVYGDPFDMPFDARVLTACPQLRRVEIRGAVAHLEALLEADLSALEFRYVPDLTGLPPLSSWSGLDKVVAWNSDAEATKQVRAQIRRMPEGPGFRSASKGRDAAWFATEYGLPFSGWPKCAASQATRAFRSAAKAIAGAETAEQCLEAVDAFVRASNELPDIMTSEREDVAEAVQMLADLTDFLDEQTAEQRFDELRDF